MSEYEYEHSNCLDALREAEHQLWNVRRVLKGAGALNPAKALTSAIEVVGNSREIAGLLEEQLVEMIRDLRQESIDHLKAQQIGMDPESGGPPCSARFEQGGSL